LDGAELAKDALLSEGYDVLGCYMSPVGDAYNKKGLAPAEHRIRLCQLATQDSPFVMVDPWEVSLSILPSINFMEWGFCAYGCDVLTSRL
jgi:nicotinic acid mononucleotide adenylyltransferase